MQNQQEQSLKWFQKQSAKMGTAEWHEEFSGFFSQHKEHNRLKINQINY